jgi:hypothetical protein
MHTAQELRATEQKLLGEAVRQGHCEPLAEESQDPSSRPDGTQDDN